MRRDALRGPSRKPTPHSVALTISPYPHETGPEGSRQRLGRFLRGDDFLTRAAHLRPQRVRSPSDATPSRVPSWRECNERPMAGRGSQRHFGRNDVLTTNDSAAVLSSRSAINTGNSL